MSSKYDSIKTAAELVSEVQLHGLSLAQEDICRAQDIFGHTPIEELARLANDIGRDNEKGEPDPKGSRSSGRRATQSTFYSILSSIWHWEEVTRFWNTHTNPEHEQVEELRAKLRAEMAEHSNTKKALEEQRVSTDAEHKSLLAERAKRIEQSDKIESMKAEIHDRDMTIMELRAKLYDLLVERKEVV